MRKTDNAIERFRGTALIYAEYMWGELGVLTATVSHAITV